jgi:glycerophosphodiester phosphodiesterase
MSSKVPDAMDKDEMQDLMGTLLELRGQYRKLQWYGEVNKRGFVKITKKLDKKIESSSAQIRYLASKVDPKPFATNNKLTQDMRAINDWLSSLNEARPKDDSSSTHSGVSGSLHRVASRNALKVHPATIENLDVAIRGDDTLSMSELIEAALTNATPAAHRKFLLDLLQRAISFRAWKCIDALLKQLPSIDQDDEINKRNCLHRLLIAIGRSRAMEDSNPSNGITEMARAPVYINAAEAPIRGPDTFQVVERDPTTTLGKDDPALKVLVYVLDHLSPEQRLATHTKDVYGRIPLHYAAQYGLVAATQQLMKHMQDWQLFDVTGGIDSVGWQDVEGYAPLHLAVTGGHYRTTKALLLAEDEYGDNEEIVKARKQVEKSGASLELATRSRYHKIIELLVDAGVDVNYRDQQDETALHIAARFGYTECAEILLKAPGVNPEITEKTFGWTPLFTACVDGHLSIVELLLAAGANPSKADASGWTPQEHAALRGHIDIARRLALVVPPPRLHEGPESGTKPAQPADAAPLEDRRSNGVSKDANGTQRIPAPLKEFGHRYLKDEAMVLVSLGTMDTRKNLPPVSLESIALTDVHATQLDTALSVVVSAQGATGEPSVIDLPIQENISTSPVTFSTKDPSKVKLYFDLIPTYSGSTKKVIGRGVALLSSIKQTVGSNRMLLQGDLSVPMVAADTLDLIGTINFNFLVITPFKHPNMAISEDQTYWRSTSTMVIGHRGLGKNMASKTSLQLGENTIQSFITAANLGASYVEFDVQLTKDHVPVIYHDFLVSETGADVPVHSLTLEQFLHVNNEGTPHATSRAQSPSPTGDSNSNSSGDGDDIAKYRPHRSYSLGGADKDRRTDMRERMKHTRDFKQKGFKGNVRGDFIQSPFATLEEMFHKVPEDVGFNIEMKYPMLFETEAEGMDSYAVELNSYVDTILRLVYDMNQKRNIIFSSFNPDVCLLLSFKQPSIPVLFLTDAGASEVGDIRASSVQEAVRFASRWKLLGIVAAADPLVLCPRLIRVVKESGLVCVSYGALNNDIHNSKLQAQEGIDAVIVDSVLKVRKGLTDAEAVRAQHGNGVSTLGMPDGAEPGGVAKHVNGNGVEANGNGNGVKANGNGVAEVKVQQ